VKLLDLLAGVVEELGQQGDQLAALAQIGLKSQAVVLLQHRALGVLEDDVGQRVATGDLGLDLGVQMEDDGCYFRWTDTAY
jgi:hypothetical protein